MASIQSPPPEGERCIALPIAVRVFTRRSRRKPEWEERKAKPLKRRYPAEALVFDTETTRDPSQRLLFGVWRLYRDPWGSEPGVTCIEEGIFYPDDLPERDPRGFETLRRFVERSRSAAVAGYSRLGEGHHIVLRPLSWWVDRRLLRYGYHHADRCHVVGFNLLFDLARLAKYWSPGRGYYRGGFSFGLKGRFDATGNWKDAKYAVRLLVKAIDPRRSLFAWGSWSRGREYKGADARFVDLRALSFALTDKAHTLESACRAFAYPYEKREVAYGKISARMLEYAREDVEATAQLYRACLAELRRHGGIALDPSSLYSPATVGTRYLEAMGLERPMDKFDLHPRIHGWAMSAFFGGRAEARIVRTEVPVTHADATSMYPTVNALLGTWSLMRARNLCTEDATDRVRELLQAPDLFERCFEPGFWRAEIRVTLVEIESPQEQILPVRGFYDPDSRDPRIGLNPFSYDGRLWYMLPDVIASAILTGHPPGVVRAIRLVPRGIQDGLRPVRVRGGPEIDPRSTDPFMAMIEERQRVRANLDLPEDERDRVALFLKITANSTAYGVLARFDRRELARSATVEVFGPDELPVGAKTKNPEDPGPFCFPPVAASITAGARLVLAMLERSVTDAGGAYAFCDTDSMAIVCLPRGGSVACQTQRGRSIRALSAKVVRSILARFDDLNPYDRDLVPSFWKVEHDSLVSPLLCYTISAKRYLLFRRGKGNAVETLTMVDSVEEAEQAEEIGGSHEDELVDWKEHGLGLYLDPIDPERPRRDDKGRRIWIRQAWEWILRRDVATPLPSWARTLALTRFTVSRPTVERWFRAYNAGLSWAERIRPGSFGLLAHPSGYFADLAGVRQPAAPYESDPRAWNSLPWYDRRSGERLKVLTATGSDADELADALASGAVIVETLGQVVTRYSLRPEHKSLGFNGEPAGGETMGLLQRRPVLSAPVLTDLAGKEGNRLEERTTGEVTDPAEYRVEYGSRVNRWSALVVPVLREMGAAEVAHRTGRSRRAIERAVSGRTVPHPSNRARLTAAAAEWVAERSDEGGANPFGLLYAHARQSRSRPRKLGR